MGDLNDDLLNYEADLLEDDILDDNEDELLLSDDDNADAEVLLSDTEDWIDDELRSKPKPDEGDSSNAVSGSNDIAESVRQESPEESVAEEVVQQSSEKPRRESTPPPQTHEEPSGSNEKKSGYSTVSSTPDKSVDPVVQSQESGISNTVDSTWVNTPETCMSNNLEEIDGNSLGNNNKNNEVSSTNEEERAAQQQEEFKCVSSSIDSTPARSLVTESCEETPVKSESSEIVSSINDTPLTTTSSGTVEREAETTETEEDEREERINPKTSVEKQPEEVFIKGIKVPPPGSQKPHSGPNNFAGITPLYPVRPDFTYGPGQNRAPFPTRPGFGPMRNPYFMPRPGFGPIPMHRPDMRHSFDPLRPLRQQMPMYRGPMGAPYPPNVLPPSQIQPYPVQPPVIPKKVLINPNFKGGGLEAATSQLIKDTQQFGARSLTDEELLRQQEEFITKNLMHVEKRRHESPPLRVRSRSRSPRSRSRSYSPQRKRRSSREKEWRPYNNKRNWRRNNDEWNKRRRFEDKEKDENPDDDDETREYRRKVAEQKALREKMLRDKERRRRELAEEKKRLLQEEEEKRKKDESALKCKPVVVTKKIISLKAIKSSSDNEDLIKKSSQDSGLSSSGDNNKKLSLKKSDDDSKTTAVVKPLPKTISKPIIDDIDEKLEAELLEESRTPSPPPPLPINTNRRVIIKSNNKTEVPELTEDPKKRVFDRLDRKSANTTTIGIDSNAKRKIQRLVSDKTK